MKDQMVLWLGVAVAVVGDVASWMFGVLPFPGSRCLYAKMVLLFMVHIYTKRERKKTVN